MTPSFAQALTTALLHFTWQGMAVGFLLWVVLLLLRNRSAAARYVASCTALAVLVLLPAITALDLYPESPAAPFASGGAVAVPPGPALAYTLSRLDAAQPWVLAVWSLGVLLFSLRLAWGARQVHILRRRGTPPDDSVPATVAALAARMGIGRPVQVLISSLAEVPSVVGWICPVLLLPSATLLGLTPEQLEAVLAHELAHIKRYDYLVNVLQMVVETLLFYHPVVWWVSARIRRERELCCDDMAVQSCGDALCYARALTILERMRIAAPRMALAGTGGPLRYRISRIVGAGNERPCPSRMAGLAALCLGLACLAFNLSSCSRGSSFESHRRVKLGADKTSPQPGVDIKFDNGGRVRLGDTQRLLKLVKKGAHGTVVVEATLDGRGNVSNAWAVEQTVNGQAETRDAAMEIVRQTHFDSHAAGGRVRATFTYGILPPIRPPTPGAIMLDERASSEMVGRKVTFPIFEGISDRLLHEIGPLLPVRHGDVLTEKSMEQLRDLVRRFHEQFVVSFNPQGSTGVDVRFTPPTYSRE